MILPNPLCYLRLFVVVLVYYSYYHYHYHYHYHYYYHYYYYYLPMRSVVYMKFTLILFTCYEYGSFNKF